MAREAGGRRSDGYSGVAISKNNGEPWSLFLGSRRRVFLQGPLLFRRLKREKKKERGKERERKEKVHQVRVSKAPTEYRDRRKYIRGSDVSALEDRFLMFPRTLATW